MKNKKNLTKKISFLFFGILILMPYVARADVMNPEWFSKHCPIGQKEVECSFSYQKPFTDPDYSNCKRYMTDEHYYELVSHGSTFGGEIRFCYDANKTTPSDYSDFEDQPMFNESTLIIMIAAGAAGIAGLVIIYLLRKNHGG